jgi:hypothetical protein
MSYLGYRATGASIEDFFKAAQLAPKILEDPALPEVIRIAREIDAAERARRGPPKPLKPGEKPKPPQKGVGLKNAIVPLNLYLTWRRRPWLPWAAGAGVLALAFALGWKWGKR